MKQIGKGMEELDEENIYEKGIMKWLPIHKIRKGRKNDWFYKMKGKECCMGIEIEIPPRRAIGLTKEQDMNKQTEEEKRMTRAWVTNVELHR